MSSCVYFTLVAWCLVTASSHTLPDRFTGQTFSARSLHRLVRRGILTSYENFHFVNVTFPCNQTETNRTYLQTVKLQLQLAGNDAPHEEEVQARRVHTLEDEDMKLYFKYKGGTFAEEYLAIDKSEAEDKFTDARLLRYHRRSMGARPAVGGIGGGHATKRESGRTAGKDRVVDKRRRQRRDIIVFDTQLPTRIDIDCSPAGAQSDYDANYLNLCTVCSAKRILPTDRFPNIINEVFCNETENGCLGNGNGKCVPTTFNVHLLKRREDVCRLCIKQDETLAVDEWELYTETINVGCECLLSANSLYRNQFFTNNHDRGGDGGGPFNIG